MGSSCAPQTKTELVDRTSRAQLLMNRHLQALVRTQDIENGSPAPAGNSRDSELNVAPGGNTRAANPSDSSTPQEDPRTTEGTGTQAKTRGREPGPVPQHPSAHRRSQGRNASRFPGRNSRRFTSVNVFDISVDSESVDDQTEMSTGDVRHRICLHHRPGLRRHRTWVHLRQRLCRRVR